LRLEKADSKRNATLFGLWQNPFASFLLQLDSNLSTTLFVRIEYIWARDDATGKILAVAKYTAADTPELKFKVPPGTKSITSFESCNLHGVWKSEPAAVA
jgi:hypothetical protein